MSDEVWLALDEHNSIGIDRARAMAMNEGDFARLYRSTVCGSSRREAKAWARKQVVDRALAGKDAG